MKFRLKPIEVEAMEMTAATEITVGRSAKTCQVGDFLVRNPDGSIHLVGHEAFYAAYESCDPGAILMEEAKPKRRHRRKVNGLGPRTTMRDIEEGMGKPPTHVGAGLIDAGLDMAKMQALGGE